MRRNYYYKLNARQQLLSESKKMDVLKVGQGKLCKCEHCNGVDTVGDKCHYAAYNAGQKELPCACLTK